MTDEIHEDAEIVVAKNDHGRDDLTVELSRTRGHSSEKTLSNVGSVDSFHEDEAAKIIADYVAAGGPEDWSELEERNLTRKIDRRLLPVLAFTYFMMWYDKGILSQAVSIHLSTHPIPSHPEVPEESPGADSQTNTRPSSASGTTSIS
jgi:hypothetical protein